MKDRVIIFGCSNQDGYYLGQALKGYDIFAFKSHRNANGIDIRSRSNVEEIISNISPKFIFNLASIPSTKNKQRADIYNTIYVGNNNILDCIYKRQLATKVIIGSSAYMYKSSEENISLNSTVRIDNPYSLGRVNSRNLANYYHSLGVNVVSAHMFHHESYRRSKYSLIMEVASQFKEIKKGIKSHINVKSISTIKEWTHAYDMMKGLRLIAEHYNEPEIIVATGQSYSISDLIAEFAEQLSLEMPTIITENDCKTRYIGDSTKMKELSWAQTISFEMLCNEVLKQMRVGY